MAAGWLPRSSNGGSGYSTQSPSRQRKPNFHHLTLLGGTVLLLGIVFLQQRHPSSYDNRLLQSLVPDDQTPVVIEPPRDCSIPRPEPRTMSPTMIASYPGSGAKLTWKLVRSVTGVMTGDDFNHNGLVKKGQVAGIKTHFPSKCCSNADLFKPLLEVDQSVLLLRHPMNALPGYHNFVYEREQKLKNHSTRAPIEVWIEWRDENFEEELATWINMVNFWMKHHSYDHRLVITYENLVEATTGPHELYKLGKFVMRGDDLAGPEEDIVCVWDWVVNIRADEGTRRSSKRSGGPSPRPYSAEQLVRMIDELKKLKDLYPGQLGSILDGYLRTLYRSQESTLNSIDNIRVSI